MYKEIYKNLKKTCTYLSLLRYYYNKKRSLLRSFKKCCL